MKKIIKEIAVGLAVASLCGTAVAADPTNNMIQTAIQLQEEYALPSGLLLSVAEVESDFNPDCVTGKCNGLMQIHSAYSKEYAEQAGLKDYDLFDPDDSMRIAASMLAGYIDKYEGDLHYSLMCYNLGEYGAKVKRDNGTEKTGYSRKVVSKIEKWAGVEAEHIADVGNMVSSIKAAVKKWMEDFVK